mmetsp:Transcript_27586/g.63791  ORF Transcript_27586/g.63791 Transcript_27586/m.63791 type:complete len:221 (-) Transcript_27586:765-1427(-)
MHSIFNILAGSDSKSVFVNAAPLRTSGGGFALGGATTGAPCVAGATGAGVISAAGRFAGCGGGCSTLARGRRPCNKSSRSTILLDSTPSCTHSARSSLVVIPSKDSLVNSGLCPIHRVTASEKAGPSNIAACTLRRSSASFLMSASTSPVPSKAAAAIKLSRVSLSFAFLSATSCWDGHGNAAISAVDALANLLKAVGESCMVRKICSKTKKPQSFAFSC